MKKSFKMLGMAAMVLLLAVSCKKENKEEAAGETKAITFTAGISQGNGKTYLNDHTLLWSDGDKIKINDGIFTLTEGKGTNKGVFEGEAEEADVYYAVYPSSSTLSGNTATITLPAVQTYVNGSFDKDIAPMVAMTDDSKSFTFTNVCGLLRLNVNKIGKSVKKVVLTSVNPDECLAGEGIVAITGNETDKFVLTSSGSNSITVASSDGISGDNHQIVFVLSDGTLTEGFNVDFYGDEEELLGSKSANMNMEIEAGKMNVVTIADDVTNQAAEIQVDEITTSSVTAPYEIAEAFVEARIDCAKDAEFTDIIESKTITPETKEQSGEVTFNQGIEAGRTYYLRILVKNDASSELKPYCTTKAETPAPTDALSGIFTVNADGKKVYFSKGNLQYCAKGGSAGDASATANPGENVGGTWRFAENQYEYIGSGNLDAAVDYQGWVDMFGWGCTGIAPASSDSYYLYYQPWSKNASTGLSEYNYYGYGPSTNSSNPNLSVDNGSDWGCQMGTGWYTLSADEWNHLLAIRTVNGEVSYGQGKVGETCGLIILPDKWELPQGLSFVSGKSDWVNDYDETAWNKMEDAGAVFLPAAGMRYNATLYSGANSNGVYMASSCSENDSHKRMHNIGFLKNSVNPSYSSNNRYMGFSVRLVYEKK